MAATVKLHKTTQDNREKHEGGEEMRRDEIGKGNNGEENNREEENEREQLVYEMDRGYERETPKDNNGETHAHGDEQQELKDGKCRIYERKGLKLGEDEIHKPRELECKPTCGNREVGNRAHEPLEGEDYRVREPNNGTTHPAPPCTANEAANPGPREHTRFDWATETDKLFGPVPNMSEFCPTEPRFPLASPEHAPRLFGNRIPPPQPIHMTPKRSVTRPRHNTTPCACSPAVDTPSTAPPQVPAECAPTTAIQALHDLSSLRSSTPNPWGSLSRRRPHSYPLCNLSAPRSDTTNPWGIFHLHQYPGVPQQFTRRNQYPSRYPVNTHIPTTSTPKPPIPAPFGIFKTVWHPHGIRPTKPMIRVPA
jgi:hypothetical protein